MIAIHRIEAVPQGIGARLNGLPTPILSRRRKTNHSEQRALWNGRQRYAVFGRLGTARRLGAQPELAVNRTAGRQNLDSFLLKKRSERRRKVGGRSTGRIHLVLAKCGAGRERQQHNCILNGWFHRRNTNGKLWSGRRDSNPRHRPWQGRTLPAELLPPEWKTPFSPETPGCQTLWLTY